MRTLAKCSIDGCSNLEKARGWCGKHYMRWWEHGDASTSLRKQSPSGAPAQFLAAALLHQGHDCLFWPYAKNNHGYAQINIDGKKHLVQRLVCEAHQGPPPAADSHAAHSCGNGHLGCVSGVHLRWATQLENMADMVAQGRSRRGSKSNSVKLTDDQVREIHRRANAGERQPALAREFGISQPNVSLIKHGRNWKWLIGVAPEALEQQRAA